MALVLEFAYYTGVNAPIHLPPKTWALGKKKGLLAGYKNNNYSLGFKFDRDQ